MEEIEVPVLLSIVKPALAIAVVLFFVLILSELRFPQVVRLRDNQLVVRNWFGKDRTAPINEVNVYGLESRGHCEIFDFTTPEFSFKLPSTMNNIMPLIDAIETRRDGVHPEVAPNRLVPRDRNPRGRGFRPVNSKR